MLVGSIVRRNAAFFGDRDAIVEPGRDTMSWADLDARTNQLARGLRRLGIDRGDRIAVLAPNCGEHLQLCFAEAKSGIVGAPMNIRLTAPVHAADRLVVPRAGAAPHPRHRALLVPRCRRG